MKKDIEFFEDNEMGLTAEEIENALNLIVVKLVETETQIGVIVGMSGEIYDLPPDLKIRLMDTFKDICFQIVNEPDETRQ